MLKKFKLLKEIPDMPAGTIIIYDEDKEKFFNEENFELHRDYYDILIRIITKYTERVKEIDGLTFVKMRIKNPRDKYKCLGEYTWQSNKAYMDCTETRYTWITEYGIDPYFFPENFQAV